MRRHRRTPLLVIAGIVFGSSLLACGLCGLLVAEVNANPQPRYIAMRQFGPIAVSAMKYPGPPPSGTGAGSWSWMPYVPGTNCVLRGNTLILGDLQYDLWDCVP